MSDQPQYYRVTDSLENLSVRIRLRKIFGRSVNVNIKNNVNSNSIRSRREGQDAGKVPGSFVPGDEADIRVKWQEKIFGPSDIVTLSSAQRGVGRPQQHRTVPRLERDYAGHLEDLRRDGVDPLGSISEVMLFTYTDKDGFVPPSDKADGGVPGRRKLTTGDGGPHSYLEEAVTNMPRKAATSGVEPSAAASGARAGVSETAAVIQTHLAREDKFKVMYIMAAVDVNVRELAKAAKARAAASGGSSRWKRGDGDGGVHVHEQVVCSIKAHQNGTLEIAPGFSAEEPESGDEGAFLTDHTVKVMDKEGARLTTYRFTSPSGGVFSYTVENDSEPGGGVEEMEAWEAEEASRDMWKKASRQQTAGAQLLGAPATGGAVALHAFMEIVSASGFTGADRLYTEYALCLPRHWIMSANEDGGDGEGGGTNDGRHRGFQGGAGGIGGENGDFAAGGTTQVACQAYPLAVPHRSARSVATTCTATKSNTSRSLEYGSSASPTPPPANTHRYGTSTMPTTFQAPVMMAAPGAAVRAGSAVFLCLVGLLGSLGESPLSWVVFGGAVVVLAALSGSGGGAGGEGGNPVAHFGFPAEFHLINEEEGETAGIGERPQPGSFKGTFLSRFGFRTETSGTLRLRLHLAEQGRVRDSHGESGEEGGGPGIDLAGTRTVKEILRVVNAKRMGVEIGRRFSATLDPASAAAAAAAAAAPATPAGSAAPAATAPAASSTSTRSDTGKAAQRHIASDGGGLADVPRAATMPLPDSRNPFEKTVDMGGVRGGKVEAAADLLARVRDQLERSEQRTKGLLVERQGIGDIAPPR
eukprot:g12701.t1